MTEILTKKTHFSFGEIGNHIGFDFHPFIFKQIKYFLNVSFVSSQIDNKSSSENTLQRLQFLNNINIIVIKIIFINLHDLHRCKVNHCKQG